jgi:hypothetical protein
MRWMATPNSAACQGRHLPACQPRPAACLCDCALCLPPALQIGTNERNLLIVTRMFAVPMAALACVIAALTYNPGGGRLPAAAAPASNSGVMLLEIPLRLP